jgi:hypothetical protein
VKYSTSQDSYQSPPIFWGLKRMRTEAESRFTTSVGRLAGFLFDPFCFLFFVLMNFRLAANLALNVALKLENLKKMPVVIGAGEGNRTLVSGLGSPHSTIEPHPLPAR